MQALPSSVKISEIDFPLRSTMTASTSRKATPRRSGKQRTDGALAGTRSADNDGGAFHKLKAHDWDRTWSPRSATCLR